MEKNDERSLKKTDVFRGKGSEKNSSKSSSERKKGNRKKPMAYEIAVKQNAIDLYGPRRARETGGSKYS